MPIVVEYLVIVPKADNFCDSVEAFGRLLAVDSTITFNGTRLLHASAFECEYAVNCGEIEGKDQRYFHLKLTSSSDDQRSLDQFTELLKSIRSIMNRMGGNPETLWDDISFQYSRHGYEAIHRIENLMRKLIANFMLVTVGKEWVRETSPQEVKEAMQKSKRADKSDRLDYLNVLHTIDFSHLADFLLKPYSSKSPTDLLGLAAKATTLEDLQALKAQLPESNWKRYFAALVDCEDSYLKKRWEELYDLRCKVAHNAIVTKSDRDRILVLVADLQVKLQDAITKLPQVTVPRDEIENVAENAAANVSALLGEFVVAWRNFERLMIYKAREADPDIESKLGKKLTFFAAHQHLTKIGALNADHQSVIQRAQHIRNNVVHHTDTAFTDAEIAEAKEKVILYYNGLSQVSFSKRPPDGESPPNS